MFVGFFSRLKQKLLLKIVFKERYILFIPSVWFVLFLLFPFLILLKISFADYTFSMPPFTPVMNWITFDHLQVNLHFSNFLYFFQDQLYIRVYLESIFVAFVSTFFAVVFGYPFALAIHKSSASVKALLILLIVLPFYTSFLLRVYAWVGLLSADGLINKVFILLGIVDAPLRLLYTKFAVIVGIVYCYFPFMVIPLYVSLSKMKAEYLEAAYDLGCKPLKAFFQITLPQTKNGLYAGCILMFIPAIGEFVIPEILGGANTLMIGRIVWNEFFNNRDWPFAAAIAVLMFCFVIVPLRYLQNLDQADRGDSEI